MVKSITVMELGEEGEKGERGRPFLNQVQETEDEVEQVMLKMVPRGKVTGLFVVAPFSVKVMGAMVVEPEVVKGLN